MLRLPSFQFLRPRDVREAARMLADAGPGARLVSGGTDLWPKMKRRQMEARTVIGLRHLTELKSLKPTGKGALLGAGLTLDEMESDPFLLTTYPAVAAAARSISSPPLKTMGTLGGNLCVDTRCTYYDQTYEWRKSIDFCMKKDGSICWVAPGSPRCWAVSSTDLAPVMMALDARIRLVSADGERTLAANDFYNHDGIEYLTKRPEEILVGVELPAVNGDLMSFQKLRRRGSIDFPILNVAAWVRPDAGGKVVGEARIAVGGVTSRPLLAEASAAALVGRPLDSESIEEAAAKAKVGKPMDNTDLHYSWRHKMVPVWVRKALEDVRRKW